MTPYDKLNKAVCLYVNNMMRKLGKIFILVFIVSFILSCKSASALEINYNPPTDFTISKEGKVHKPGFNDPASNCASCRG